MTASLPQASTPGAAPSLPLIVQHRAHTTPDQIAYTFVTDDILHGQSITWSHLDRRARELAGRLLECGAQRQPVMLALPSGLAFVESLFACWYAGAIALPVSLPRHQRVKHRLDRIASDAGAKFAISTADTRQRLGEQFMPYATWIDAAADSDACSQVPFANATDVALLQYTSGSTGHPRGVIVKHSNLLSNCAMIADACGNRVTGDVVGWLPLFHDMGLVGLVLQTVFSGLRCVFISPERFLMRPWLWLQMISAYSASYSPAPNFAYDFCVDRIDDAHKAGLDLSSWHIAMNGSECVRPSTLDRFAKTFAPFGFDKKAFFPCYGLAEATLFVTGAHLDRHVPHRNADGTLAPESAPGGHVACGSTFGDSKLAIVDPKTLLRVAPGAIGEIWISNASVASGYWNNPTSTASTFNARMASDTAGQATWLRTGDLGFIAEAQLYITGRLRELIIIAGKNHFPVDIERTVELADPAIAMSGVVAFSIDEAGAERLVIVAEVRRELERLPANASPMDIPAIHRRIRSAVAAEHEVSVHSIALVRSGAIPRTTSGKASHLSARDAYLAGTLELIEVREHAHAHV